MFRFLIKSFFVMVIGVANTSYLSANDQKPAKMDKNKDCDCDYDWYFGGRKSSGKNRHRMHEFKDFKSISDAISSGALYPYLQLSLRTSDLAGDQVNLAGVRLGIQHYGRNYFSLGAYKTTREIKPDSIPTAKSADFIYGGFEFGGISPQRSILDVYGRMLIGAGKATVRNFADEQKNSSLAFVVDPEIGINMNFSRYLQLGVGISHRFVRGIDTYGVRGKHLSGWTFGTHLTITDFQ